MPGTVLSMQNIYLVKKSYANPLEGDTKPPEGDNSMKFVYHQLNYGAVGNATENSGTQISLNLSKSFVDYVTLCTFQEIKSALFYKDLGTDRRHRQRTATALRFFL